MELLKYLPQKLKAIVKPGIAGSMELARSLLTGSDVEDVFEFESEVHNRSLVAKLAELRDDCHFCDVTLIAEGIRINAHRVVLAAYSDYFKAMFTSEMIESRQQEIEIFDVEAPALDALINFCYFCKVEIDGINVPSILHAACLLQLSEVQGIIGTEAFHRLPVHQLVQFLSSEELVVRSEEQNDLILQFSTLQCSNVKEKRTRACGAAAEVIYVVGGCGEKSVECLDLKDAHPVWQYVAPLKLFRFHRSVAVVHGFIYAVHGLGPFEFMNNFERYDPVTDQWMSDVPPCPTGRFLLDVAALDDHFYAIGGCMALYVGGCGEKSVECLDLKDAHPVWQYVAPLKLFRFHRSVAVVHGFIYAVHGLGPFEFMNNFERYDPVTDQWMSDVPPCPTGRFLLDVAALDDHFYAIGGCMALYGGSVDIVER
nr:BTB:POZ and Kelch repeat type 1 domain containing protein [Haemonchus contortus]